MKRLELLKQTLTEEKNVEVVIVNTTKADGKFLKRTKRDLEDRVEDLQEKLQVRLSSTEPLDKAVVESLYNEVVTTKATLDLYKSFEKEFISE
jgi:hypothetical protein